MKVKELREKLELLQDDIDVKIGYGCKEYDIKFIIPSSKNIVFAEDAYEAKPDMEWLHTLCIYGKNK